MSHQEARRFKAQWIMEGLKGAAAQNKIWELEKLISSACLYFGAARRYIKEILTDLENAEKIVIQDGEVWTSEAFQEQLKKESVSDTQKLLKEAENK